MICPHCNRTIAEQDRYLMSVDRDAPDWLAILSGASGRAKRIALTLAVCVLVALLITGIHAVL